MESSSSTKPNKIRDIVRLQQLLKKWKKAASANNTKKTTTTMHSMPTTNTSGGGSGGCSRSIKFLKKTLSFSDISSSLTYGNNTASSSVVPKGYVAVCVGKQEKRVLIPTEYLSHPLFANLLREAEEEFGFQQQGVLKLPCDIDLFDQVLKMIENNNNRIMKQASLPSSAVNCINKMNCSPNVVTELTSLSHHHHTQLCN